MKKRNLLLVMLAVLLAFGLVLSCGPGGEDETIDVTLVSVVANGSTSVTSSSLTITFDKAIDGLAAGDITLSGVAVTKGALNSENAPVYNLAISGVTEEGDLNVAVAKKGFKIDGSPKTAKIILSDADKAKLAAEKASKYFGEYKTTYQLSKPNDTNEFVTFEKNTSGKYVLTIEEKKDGKSLASITFTINDDGWGVVDVPDDVKKVDPSERGEFTIGFKIKGKLTEVKPLTGDDSYMGGKTLRGFTSTDVSKDCWMYLYLGDNDLQGSGFILVRAPFSKSADVDAAGKPVTGNNEATHFVTGGDSKARVYTHDVD